MGASRSLLVVAAAGVVAFAVSPSGWFGKQKDPPGLGGLRDEGCSSRYSIMRVPVGTGRFITRSR